MQIIKNTYCCVWGVLLISLPDTLDYSRKNLSNRMSKASPLSIRSIFLICAPWPNRILTAWRSSFPDARCSVMKDCSVCPVLRLILCLCFSIFLQDTNRWNSLLSPRKHRGHCSTLPPSWDNESAVLYESLFPNPAFMHLNLIKILDHLDSSTCGCVFHHFFGRGISFSVTSSWMSAITFCSWNWCNCLGVTSLRVSGVTAYLHRTDMRFV